ncbi:uncharacterized protein VTP21DRAFT_11235 [Calcarisporiella thermophila]|uniref:uncharacterized protein n=1 Tax=Calcarisporiella thermophila TaxID=911321 RepID=UPI003744B0DC
MRIGLHPRNLLISLRRCLTTRVKRVKQLKEQKELKSLSLADLRSLSQFCGLEQTGTKLTLSTRLQTHFEQLMSNPNNAVPSSVISLDLGFANLAFVHLDREGHVLDWKRVRLNVGPGYDPLVYAKAVEGVMRELTALKAMAYVVERQRVRTLGSPNVLQTVLMVNFVEAMIHAFLVQHRQTYPDTVVEYVLPRNVGRHFGLDEMKAGNALIRKSANKRDAPIENEEDKSAKNSARNYYEKKRRSVLMVEEWISTDKCIKCTDDFKVMFTNEAKKDDLSDCLLQAVAWMEWRKNAFEEAKRYIKK